MYVGLVGVLGVAACFEDPAQAEGGASSGGSTDSSSTSAAAETGDPPGTTQAPADSTGGSEVGTTDGESTGCVPGEAGCICDAGACVDGHACDRGLCQPIPASCGNGAVDLGDGELCDDANVRSGDGCSSFCQWERHCFVEHLGGATTVGVRAFGVSPDGSLEERFVCDWRAGVGVRPGRAPALCRAHRGRRGRGTLDRAG